MPLTSILQHADPLWPMRFAEERSRLDKVFGPTANLQHIGSTAVPGLAAKPEIDMLLFIDKAGVPDRWADGLAALGYRRGGDLSPGHHFFKRDVTGVRTHKLHLCVAGHPTAREMLAFRDHLRQSPEDRQRYEALKFALEATNRRGIGEYLDAKAPFIRAILGRL